MVDRKNGSQVDTNPLQEAAYKTNAQIWMWGLLDQAKKNGGSVTIQFMGGSGGEIKLTVADIEAAQKHISSKT